jgi:hypothetical protein
VVQAETLNIKFQLEYSYQCSLIVQVGHRQLASSKCYIQSSNQDSDNEDVDEELICALAF